MQMKTVHRVTAALVFAVATIVYLMTMAPTMSFWDCGEFIACSYIGGVPHPPGSPLFLIIGHIFSFLPFGDHGWRINLISVLASGFTVMLTYLIIVHLVREWKGQLKTKSDWYLAIFSGVIGALTFAFTHSFWFNAVEAEVYASSMLFTALVVWLILVWSTKADEPGNERYLLLIAYLIGLAIGVHLLNLLAIPFVAMIFYYKKFKVTTKSFIIMTIITGLIMVAIYPGLVIWLPQMALYTGFTGLAVLFLVVLYLSYWSINKKKHVAILVFNALLLIMIGYSSYSMIYIRSGLDPAIDENDPENVKRFVYYMKREQYGEHSVFDRYDVWRNSENANKYSSVWDFFWNYQINKMYNRYFLWQFVGLSNDEYHVDVHKFWGLPLLLGLIGLVWHFKRDPKRALAVFALFFMTGLAIVLYLNQPDPQPRERDYSYVGSFFAYSLWVGLGFAGVMELLRDYLKERAAKYQLAAFIILLLIVPGNMLAKNFHPQSRHGNYVAWDYSYNMLMTCEPNAILFTNGDNDTFPLWYLQEVEHVRKDVRIVNLSLLNTDWYIKQLRDWEPRVPMNISDFELQHVGIKPWKTAKYSLKVSKQVAEKEAALYQKEFGLPAQLPDKIEFTLKPTLKSPYGQGYLRTQDWMILNILVNNHWRRPIYFAVTVPRSNMLGDLANYFRMDGLVMKLVPFRNWRISPTNLEKNLTKVYKYRNLNNPKVYYNLNIKSLLQNYRSGFLRLAEYYVTKGELDKVKQLLSFMDQKISPQVIPWMNRPMRLVTEAFHAVADSSYRDSLLNNDKRVADLPVIAEHLLRMRQAGYALPFLEKSYELNPTDPRTLGMLINAYQQTGEKQKIVRALENWLKLYPQDKTARKMLDQYKSQLKQ